MQKPSLLNELYDQYTGGLLEKKQFEGMIFKNILDDPRRFHLYQWREEDPGDFVSWLYPRLSKSIDSYRNTGASFDTYIGAVIRLSAKEYRSRMLDKEITEYASWTARFPDEYICQNEPDYPEPMPVTKTAPVKAEAVQGTRTNCPEPEPALWRKKTPRQLLILILKCYYYMSEELLDRIAPLAGIEKEYLKKMIDNLRALRVKRDEELRCLRERIYCQFYRCIIYEKKRAAMSENSTAFLKLESQIRRARQRLAAMKKRLAGIRPDATNRQIAETLGIAKGTVDYSLYALKNRWNNDPNRSILN
jgi:hypothetical protein